MVNVLARACALVRNDEGQDLIEYALLAGLNSLVAVVTMTTAGTQVAAIWTQIAAALTDAATP